MVNSVDNAYPDVGVTCKVPESGDSLGSRVIEALAEFELAGLVTITSMIRGSVS